MSRPSTSRGGAHGRAAPPAIPPTMRVLERGWLSANNILLFDDRDSATLVDTGYVTRNRQTLALVRRALGERRLARIVNTHLHADHCGGNALLARELRAAIFIPPGHAAAVAAWDEEALGYAATGQACERFRYDGLLAPGQRLRMGSHDWEVLVAPGHDPNSIVLWNPAEAILLSADALWQHGFGAIFPEIEGESGFAEQRAMLDLIGGLGARLVIPGHGPPFTDVADALARAHRRLDALASDPARNARQVARVLVKFHLLDVGEIALEALVAHLEGARYFRLVNERYVRLPFAEFVRWTVHELVAAGTAELDGGTVRNRDPAPHG